jgi:hypothetical protein
MSPLGQKWSFVPGSPNVRYAPEADMAADVTDELMDIGHIVRLLVAWESLEHSEIASSLPPRHLCLQLANRFQKNTGPQLSGFQVAALFPPFGGFSTHCGSAATMRPNHRFG